MVIRHCDPLAPRIKCLDATGKVIGRLATVDLLTFTAQDIEGNVVKGITLIVIEPPTVLTETSS